MVDFLAKLSIIKLCTGFFHIMSLSMITILPPLLSGLITMSLLPFR